MDAKPQNINEYKKWVEKKAKVKSWDKEKNYYENVTRKVREDFAASDFWNTLLGSLSEYDQEYLVKTKYPLLLEASRQPKLHVKTFESLVEKTYRKNVIDNQKWDGEPTDGWILPSNWYCRIDDVIRTTVAVKYLDGVDFVIGKIKALCDTRGALCNVHMEAREEGYYAAHLYVSQSFEIPGRMWSSERVEMRVEVQVTTQLQEVIRQLLHKYYNKTRLLPTKAARSEWQWDYKSDEFLAGYLGHILHYMEGMIMEVRSRQTREIR